MPGDVVGEACATSTTTATSLADAGGRAPDLAKPIMPETGCQFLTKVRHSAFYTALAYLLRQLVERLIPTRPDHRAVHCTTPWMPTCGTSCSSWVPGRVAHIDATLVDAALKMMHRNMRAELMAAA